MNLATIISVVVLVLIISLAIGYIIREKRRGTVCIGCPNAGTCQKHGKNRSALHSRKVTDHSPFGTVK